MPRNVTEKYFRSARYSGSLYRYSLVSPSEPTMRPNERRIPAEKTRWTTVSTSDSLFWPLFMALRESGLSDSRPV